MKVGNKKSSRHDTGKHVRRGGGAGKEGLEGEKKTPGVGVKG